MMNRRWRAAASMIVPVLVLMAACGSGGSSSADSGETNATPGGASADPSAGSAAGLADSVAAVTDSQLKGVTISTADFFGDCSSKVGDNTDLAQANDECSTFQTLINKFNADNKYGIKVTQRGAGWKSYYDSLNAAFAAKSPPDVTLMHEANIPNYSSRGLLVPLGDLYKLVGIEQSDFTDPAKKGVTIDGKVWAVPFDEHASLFHVNLDLMKKAGLVDADGAPKLPSSPEELKKQAAQFHDATGKQYLAFGTDFNIPFRLFYTLTAQLGTPAFTADGKVQVDTKEGKTALTLIKDIYSSDIANSKQTYDSAQQAWLNGNVGILMNGTWVVNQYVKQVKFDYMATNFPQLYSQPAVWANSHTWTIPVQQKDADPVKYRAALVFAGWMYDHDKAWALGSGHLSVRKSVLSSDDYKNAPQRANYVETAANAELVPQVVGEQGAEDALQHAIEGVYLSGESVDSALTQAQTAVTSALSGK